MIPQETIRQIIDATDIIDVVGEFVNLKKRGVNYIGNCPFHNEKTPSFTVSPSKEIFKCFGCGKSGNAIGFVMEHEKYSYVEALKWLAARYRIPVEEKEVSDEVKQQQHIAESLYVLNNFAQKFFSENLLQTEEGRTVALTYLEHRNFTAAIIQQFQIGYCNSSGNSFAKAALKQQFSKEVLLKSGLVTERNGELFDNYRGRIIFPIHNLSGRIVGFGARVIGKADKAPKYINTPENEIYVKNKTLYGIYFARTAIGKQNECLLVEGYTDVTALQQAGIENVVASGGTSLTEAQLKLIHKFTDNLTILYDGDAAGVKAALRGLDMALEEGLNVKIALIPEGEDPDGWVQKKGSAAFLRFVSETKKDFIFFQLEAMLQDAGNDISKKNEVVNAIAKSISKINRPEDFVKQQEFSRRSAQLLNIEEGALLQLIAKYKREEVAKITQREEKQQAATGQRVPESEPLSETSELTDFDDLQEKNVLKLLVEHGHKPWDENATVAMYMHEALESFNFNNALYEKVFDEYFVLTAAGEEPDEKYFLHHADEAVKQLFTNLLMQPHELSTRWDEKLKNFKEPTPEEKTAYKTDVFKSLCFFRLKKIKTMFDENQKALEQEKDFEEQLKLIAIHNKLKEVEVSLTRELGTVILK